MKIGIKPCFVGHVQFVVLFLGGGGEREEGDFFKFPGGGGSQFYA